MISNKELSYRLFKATFAPDFNTFDDFMFAGFRALVAGAHKKSDKHLTAADFEMVLNLMPADSMAETVSNIIIVTDALNARVPS